MIECLYSNHTKNKCRDVHVSFIVSGTVVDYSFVIIIMFFSRKLTVLLDTVYLACFPIKLADDFDSSR